MSEPNEAKKDTEKTYVQNLTDLASFNSFGVVTLSNGQRVNVQMTTRHAMTADAAYKDFQAHVAFLDMCARDHAVEFWDGSRKENGNTPRQGSGESSGESKDTKSAKHDDRKPLSAAEIPAELSDLNVDVYAVDFDYFVVEPKPEQKSVVSFYADGLQYPVGAIMNKWKYDTIKDRLATLVEKEIDPSKAEKYRIAGVQYFTLGKEYEIQKGVNAGKKAHYKDLQLLKPIF